MAYNQKSIVTVTSAADDYDLTTVGAVKTDLGITTNAQDDQIAAWIRQQSKVISGYCQRVFQVETISEQFREVYSDELVLARFPAVSITSITENDEALATDDYEFDPDTGFVYRLSDDVRDCWNADKIVVVYRAGFTVIPYDVERACLDLVKVARSRSSRDPLLKSLEIPDVVTEMYWVGAVSGESSSGIPAEISASLDRYVVRRVGAV